MGIGAGEQLHPVAVLGIGGLLWALDWLCPGLRAQNGDKEGGGFRVFAKGRLEAAGGACGEGVL